MKRIKIKNKIKMRTKLQIKLKSNSDKYIHINKISIPSYHLVQIIFLRINRYPIRNPRW